MNQHEIVHTIVFPLNNEGGNPCPVILNSDHLSSKEMQAIARQLGHETCFVSTSKHKDCEFQFRYFVPNNEMEMCVHATIGSVTVLVNKGMVKNSPLNIDTLLGPIQAEWRLAGGEIEVEVTQFPPKVCEKVPPIEDVSRALNVKPAEIEAAGIKSVSTSRFKLLIHLKSTAILHKLSPNFPYLWEICEKYGATGFYPFSIEDYDEKLVQARQFPNKAGYDEDPATGVAASALGTYFYLNKSFNEDLTGVDTYKIVQGVSMGRPSYIEANVYSENGEITKTSITGKAMLL